MKNRALMVSGLVVGLLILGYAAYVVVTDVPAGDGGVADVSDLSVKSTVVGVVEKGDDAYSLVKEAVAASYENEAVRDRAVKAPEANKTAASRVTSSSGSSGGVSPGVAAGGGYLRAGLEQSGSATGVDADHEHGDGSTVDTAPASAKPSVPSSVKEYRSVVDELRRRVGDALSGAVVKNSVISMIEEGWDGCDLVAKALADGYDPDAVIGGAATAGTRIVCIADASLSSGKVDRDELAGILKDADIDSGIAASAIAAAAAAIGEDTSAGEAKSDFTGSTKTDNLVDPAVPFGGLGYGGEKLSKNSTL